MKALTVLSIVAFSITTYAQQPDLQFFRYWDQRGVHVFEPAKSDSVIFDGVKLRIGGAFTQQYQGLNHENNAIAVLATDGKTNLNQLYPLGKGFNLATANLNMDVQLEDGIRLSLENYMSSRHHPEFWVKGGYIQVDKLPMLGNPDWFSKYLRVKLGHFQINYGDQQFRRTDNGNAFFNPFVGNYIMDAFTTEIGGELYLFPVKNVVAMVGLTGGLINGDVRDYGEDQKKNPSIYTKLAYDNQVNSNLRIRISGSLYRNNETPRNTLYGGDRTGSRFYFAMEPQFFVSGGTITASSTSNRFTSGRINPSLTNNITTWQINPFIKFKGLELFGAYEQATGYANGDPRLDGQAKPDKRTINQVSVEGVYRFLKNEQVFIGGRYNTVTGELDARIRDSQNQVTELTINRIELTAGWFATRNLLLKAAYINQEYQDFPSTDIRAEGKFDGFMIEAVLGF
ncbi:MAG: hypothetical protein HC912_01830 [Saprospiraceae bacterium]|nr:hypothetical protein [Saprospiraceae bacterium]